MLSRRWCCWAVRNFPRFSQSGHRVAQCGCARLYLNTSGTCKSACRRNFSSNRCTPGADIKEAAVSSSDSAISFAADSHDGIERQSAVNVLQHFGHVTSMTRREPISDPISDPSSDVSDPTGSDDSTCTLLVEQTVTAEKSETFPNENFQFENTNSGSGDVMNIPGSEKSITDRPLKSVVKPVYNFAALVNQSETLSKLVLLGVDLSVVEKNKDAADLIVRLDFENDVKPYLFLLHDIGVANESLGPVLTRNPMILQESLENLRLRVDYFRSKNFTQDAISRIVTKAPNILSFSTIDIDKRLGLYQQEFKLTGTEVREAITRLPKLLTWNIPKVKEVKTYMKEFLGFSKSEIKEILLIQPKVLLSDKHQLGKRFDYLYNVMKIPHSTLVQWPEVFRSRLLVIRDRHRFLKHLGRDQFDPAKENYVSLQMLVTGKDRDFCFRVAKSSVSQFNDFLKSL